MNLKRMLAVTVLVVALVMSAASPAFAGYRSFTLRNGQWNKAIEANKAFERDFGTMSNAHYFVLIPEHIDINSGEKVPDTLRVVVGVWRNNRVAYQYVDVQKENVKCVPDQRLTVPMVQFAGLWSENISCVVKYNPARHIIGELTAPAFWYIPGAE